MSTAGILSSHRYNTSWSLFYNSGSRTSLIHEPSSRNVDTRKFSYYILLYFLPKRNDLCLSTSSVSNLGTKMVIHCCTTRVPSEKKGSQCNCDWFVYVNVFHPFQVMNEISDLNTANMAAKPTILGEKNIALFSDNSRYQTLSHE